MRVQDEEVLQRSSLFRFLPEEHFERLRPLLNEEHFEFGDVIVQQGEPADSFYVLLSGRARAIKLDPNGGEIALATLRPGDVFGEARSRRRWDAHGLDSLQHFGGRAAAGAFGFSSGL